MEQTHQFIVTSFKPVVSIICEMLLQFVDSVVAVNQVDVLINMNIFNFDDNNGFKTVKGGGHIPGSDSRSTLKVKI